MRFINAFRIARFSTAAIIVISTVYVLNLAAQGTKDGSTPASERVQVVNAPQKGDPPSGPNQLVVEHDQGLATHTIYRPATLGPGKNPLVVWGEGGCAKNGLTFPEYLREIASYGFVIVADGPPIMPSANGRGAGKAGPPQMCTAQVCRSFSREPRGGSISRRLEWASTIATYIANCSVTRRRSWNRCALLARSRL